MMRRPSLEQLARPFAALVTLVVLGSFSAACGSDAAGSNNDVDTGVSADAGADAASDAAADAGSEPDAAEADSDLPIPEGPWPVSEPGPYNVGFTEREITYEAQGTDEPRTLRLAVWYPTREPWGDRSTYFDLFVRREAFLDAPVGIDEPAPLLVFSHGNSSLAEQSYFMTEFFASHGWVVASPDHTGNTVRDTQGAIDLTSAVFRPQDISEVIDYMLALPEDEPLSGLVSSENIVLSGHSFGGFTTLANAGGGFAVDELVAECDGESPPDFCEIFDGPEEWLDLFRQGFLDERIKVAIPQTPGGVQAFGDGLADIEMPTLLFTGGMDRTLPNEEEGDPIWERMQGSQHMRIDVTKGGHFTFSNMCSLLGAVEMVRNDGCSDEFIEPEQAFELINAYSLAFARYHLFNDQTNVELIEGEVRPYDGIEISYKPEQ